MTPEENEMLARVGPGKAGRDPHGTVRAQDGNDVIRFVAGKNFSDRDKSPVAI